MSDLELFRSRVRHWLDMEAPRNGWSYDDDTAELTESEHLLRAQKCQRMLIEAGLANLTWPTEFGGQGLGLAEQVVFNEESRACNLPLRPFIIGFGMCAPTLLALGTPDQQSRYLPPLLAGDEIWCQLFSEPGAGSDVASLTTRAVRAGDDWIVNGQKVWTSGAHFSDYGILLARTDPDVPKHKGLTMFIVDMRSDGITVRPIEQMDGGARFNEVYFDNVRIPAGAVIGTVDDGWHAALTTLSNERVSLGAARPLDEVAGATELAAAARSLGRFNDAVVRQEVARVWIAGRVVELLGERVTAAILQGQIPGPEGSLSKLCRTEYTRKASRLGSKLAGTSAIAWDGDSRAAQALLYTPSLSIAGGTDEVLRSIIGERVLGLPKEPVGNDRRPLRESTRSKL